MYVMKVHASYCYFLFFCVFKIRLFFREIFLFFVLMAGEKCCKLVLHVDKTIILNLAMMTIIMHFYLNTAILFLLLA